MIMDWIKLKKNQMQNIGLLLSENTIENPRKRSNSYEDGNLKKDFFVFHAFSIFFCVCVFVCLLILLNHLYDKRKQ